ncbi:MAG: transposase, partial [Bacteroidales bacterium]|nr:transposase [Bacteroidales bacterium]
MKQKGNPLYRLLKVIDFEMFRSELEENMLNHDKKSNVGAKPIDVVLMFKLLILQRLYNISDEMLEEQIIDRQSFNDFLGLSSGDKVPDAQTIWLFKNRVIEKGLEKILFKQFNGYLDGLGLFINEGHIIDASFVEVPRQRNHRDENKQIFVFLFFHMVYDYFEHSLVRDTYEKRQLENPPQMELIEENIYAKELE